MCLVIHTGIKINPCELKGSQGGTGLLEWYIIYKSAQYNSFEDQAPVDH